MRVWRARRREAGCGRARAGWPGAHLGAVTCVVAHVLKAGRGGQPARVLRFHLVGVALAARRYGTVVSLWCTVVRGHVFRAFMLVLHLRLFFHSSVFERLFLALETRFISEEKTRTAHAASARALRLGVAARARPPMDNHVGT